MNRTQLIDTYRKLVLGNDPWPEFYFCAHLLNDLLEGKRGAVKAARIHLRSRAYEARQTARPATL